MRTATDRSLTSRPRHGQFTRGQKQLLRRRLLAWYQKRARDLPWRRSRDPYRVWISEIMLQQTQVATVRAYFAPFIRAFPNVHRLAAADEQRVLRLWEGLGYYRRARQLHAAARLIVAQHNGQFPQSIAVLRTLPGVGRYTAGAIASIAFNQRAAILETNTIRLLSRLIGYQDDPRAAPGQRILWQVAEDILPRNTAQFNQALMELGSLICTPGEPRCDECPLSGLCVAKLAGNQHHIPRPRPGAKFTPLREAAVFITSNRRVLMRHCGRRERWAGLWDFPRFELAAVGTPSASEEIVAKTRAQTGVTCRSPALVRTIKHAVTRYRITLECYEAQYVAGRPRSANGVPVRWTPLAELSTLPLSTTGRKMAGWII
jgi:A/G-specific adenine glycosylase